MLKHYAECDCHSPEHTLHLVSDEDAVYMHVFLGESPWYKRVVKAIMYVFGHKSNYGHFDEFVVSKNNLDKIIGVLESLKREIQ